VTGMTDWLEKNDQYLGAALAWLRHRLEYVAASGKRPALVQSPAGILDRLKSRPPQGAAGPAADEAILSAFCDMERAGGGSPPPALIGLGQLLGLSRFEQEILLLCAGMELDTRFPALCARAQDNPDRPYPTFALAMVLFDEPRWEAMSPGRPLRYWRLIEIGQSASEPLTSSPLRADERIVNYLKGLNNLDDRLLPLLIPCWDLPSGEMLPPSQQEQVERIRDHLMKPRSDQRVPVFELLGPDTPSKQLVARCAAATVGRHIFRLPAGIVPSQPDELEALARLWERECTLLPLALYLDPGETEAQAPPVNRFLARSNGIFFLDVRDTTPLLCPYAAFEVSKPTHAEQEALWSAAAGMAGPAYARRLAGQFDMNLSSIQEIAETVPPAAAPETARQALWNACVATTRPRLDLLAQRLVPKATLADMVLPEREHRLLLEIAAQVSNRTTVYDDWGFRKRMNRGLGISALFAGESGTGKTMAAEAIANELNLDLYRIDLSQVVSKYIGETEKNLRRIFDAAEEGGAILFFDEADALFGKRSEVKDSHDRYANIEINYLLQRMEAFQGLAILATNAKSALDSAFVRRLRFIIDFPFPGPVERKAIWARVFPADMPCEPLDLDRLARFNLTGGSVHNIALNSAFLAAGSTGKVTMRLVLDAVKTEFVKMNRPVLEAEFR
jgi:hypothetical protein